MLFVGLGEKLSLEFGGVWFFLDIGYCSFVERAIRLTFMIMLIVCCWIFVRSFVSSWTWVWVLVVIL